MKIVVRKAAPDVYSLNFDDCEIALEERELKELLLQITKILLPHEREQSAEERAKTFMRHIKNANDVGIQKFLRVADEEDILILLKAAENDEVLLNKFYANMTELSRKMFAEDLTYKFKDDVPRPRLKKAIERLGRTAKKLENEGSLVFENITARKVADSLAKR
ncbi:MAG: FliG C-terminal domain-containing protein [Rhodospirillales bacterium]